MESLELKEIRESLKPIFISSWVFGVPRVTHKFIYRLAYSILISLIYIGTFSATFKARVNVVSNYNYAMVIFYIVSQVMMFIGGVGTIVFWIGSGARALENTIVDLAVLDIKLKGLGIKIRHQDVANRQIIILILFTIIWLTVSILHEYLFSLSRAHDDTSLFLSFCYAYSSNVPHILILLGEFIFSIIMFMFYQRFLSINQVLITQSTNHNNEVAVLNSTEFHSSRTRSQINSDKEMLMKIRRFYEAHNRLCKITESLNSVFSLLLYCTLSVTFSLLLYRGIVIYTLIFVKFDQLDIRLFLSITWLVYYGLKLWLITLNCCNTSREANRLGIVLHGIVINDNEFYEMLCEYSLQLYRNKLRFTAGGSYSIDISLINVLVSYFSNYILYAVDMWNGIHSNAVKPTTAAP